MIFQFEIFHIFFGSLGLLGYGIIGFLLGSVGQVPDREGEQRREQGVLPQDEGGLLQVPGGGGRGRRTLM